MFETVSSKQLYDCPAIRFLLADIRTAVTRLRRHTDAPGIVIVKRVTLQM